MSEDAKQDAEELRNEGAAVAFGFVASHETLETFLAERVKAHFGRASA